MFEFGKNRLTVAAAGGALGVVSLAACGGSSGGANGAEPLKVDKSPIKGAPFESPYHGILKCIANKPDKWQQTPSNFNVPVLAKELKVTPEAVANGKFGGADCDVALHANQTQGAKASVEGKGDNCAVVGSGANPAKPEEVSKFILAVCASEQMGPNV